MPDYLTERDWQAELKRRGAVDAGGLGKALGEWRRQRTRKPADAARAIEAVAAEAAAAQKAHKDNRDVLRYLAAVIGRAKVEAKKIAARDKDDKVGKDLELLAALKRAKTRRMQFVLVAKGTTGGKLMLGKVRVKPALVSEARKEFRGGRLFRGECFFESGRYIFEFPKAPPAILGMLVKRLVKDRTGLSIKPVCRVAAEDDRRDGSKSKGVSAAARKAIVARLNGLADELKAFATAGGSGVREAQRLFRKVERARDRGDMAGATQSLDDLASLARRGQ
jgi:hypothetical protein